MTNPEHLARLKAEIDKGDWNRWDDANFIDADLRG
jgi:hypothetical protein